MSVSLLATAAFCPHGVDSLAYADKFNGQSFPHHEIWGSFSTASDVVMVSHGQEAPHCHVLHINGACISR